MSCCGSRYAGPQARSVSAGTGAAPPASTGVPSDPIFEYVGPTSLVVMGPVTGRRYHFERRGARLAISRHDAASLLYLPVLKSISGVRP